jgi:hypothetical protein
MIPAKEVFGNLISNWLVVNEKSTFKERRE